MSERLDPDLPPRESGDGQEVEEPGLQPTAGLQGIPSVATVPAIQQPQAAVSSSTNQKSWSANAAFLSEIENLGFSKILAEKALFYTGNKSADGAVCWILDHPESHDDQIPLDLEGYSGGSSSSSSSPDEPFNPVGTMTAYKMVFVVNNSLKMGLGKVAAQVAHATLGLYRELISRQSFLQALNDWTDLGETKVVLRGDDSEQLLQLQHRARLAGLHSYLVQDAGRTQIAAGSMTVLSIFGATERVDEVTGQLKLM